LRCRHPIGISADIPGSFIFSKDEFMAPGKKTSDVQPSSTKSETSKAATPDASPLKTLLLGLVFGVIFGFLLQKGGVAKYHILIGQLLLVDYTVLKIMMSAVVTGALGIHFLHRAGLVELHIKPARLASNIVGGLLFGGGFALSAYCPGTGAAALGQGNYDALAMVAGMVAGSYIFAEASGWTAKHLDPIADYGKLTLHDVIPLNRTLVVLGVVAALCGVLVAVEFLAVR